MKSMTALLFCILTLTSFSQNVELYTALEQIKADAIIEQGLTGKGISIGIIDAGFDGISEWNTLKKIQINDIQNYVPDSVALITDGNHGAWVLSYIGGQEIGQEGKNYYEGIATNAQYYLARNEYGKKDYRVEEIYLEQALDNLYKKGVRLVNISSGYTDKYEDRKERYKPKDMNGETTYISKVCKKYSDLGMILVVTAGNEGNYFDFWGKYISAPADVENVITVGATHFSLLNPEINGKFFLKAIYSGTGPEFLPYVKPDVVCFSDRGCSFSTPIITGLIACMLEIDSSLSLTQIRNILHKSSTLYPFPNNYIGYGVPDTRKVLALLKDNNAVLDKAKLIVVNENTYMLQTKSDNIVMFYKKDEFHVIKQKKAKSKNGNYKISRKGSNRTTVIIDNEDVIEIVWN
jgi:subtilisin family serine protease